MINLVDLLKDQSGHISKHNPARAFKNPMEEAPQTFSSDEARIILDKDIKLTIYYSKL